MLSSVQEAKESTVKLFEKIAITIADPSGATEQVIQVIFCFHTFMFGGWLKLFFLYRMSLMKPMRIVVIVRGRMVNLCSSCKLYLSKR